METNGQTIIEEQPAKTARKKPNTRSYKTELKKSQAKERRLILIAMLGWSLALIQIVITLVVNSG